MIPSVEAGRRFTVAPTVIAPGAVCPYRADDWRNALVSVERGEIELEFTGGTRQRFARGAVLWLAPLSLRALHNPGPVAALLVVVSPPENSRPMSSRRCAVGTGDHVSDPDEVTRP